jgi:hypothetical protein
MEAFFIVYSLALYPDWQVTNTAHLHLTAYGAHQAATTKGMFGLQATCTLTFITNSPPPKRKAEELKSSSQNPGIKICGYLRATISAVATDQGLGADLRLPASWARRFLLRDPVPWHFSRSELLSTID